MKLQKYGRVIALLLCTFMLLSSLPAVSFAEGEVQRGNGRGCCCCCGGCQSCPMGVSEPTQVEPLSGECGDNITFLLDGDGVLAIDGSGDMWNFSADGNDFYNQPAPWKDRAGEIKTILISDSVTSIGSNAFRGCTELQEVAIAITVSFIGDYAFFDCPSLKAVVIPGSVYSVGSYALGYDRYYRSVPGLEITAGKGSGAYFYGKENGIALNVRGFSSIGYFDPITVSQDLEVYAGEIDESSPVLGIIPRGQLIYPATYINESTGEEWAQVIGVRDESGQVVWGKITAREMAGETTEVIRGWVLLETGLDDAE